ncbi:MarR family winged helix-turn-helix transcriptional regulator [Streptomyces sp. TRM70350]|uniref:MarR family winged helix-turn-helix transcriptional regulator n=1 Tax=Streptomyces sp. TRM70350 TaxID=2856165 RepID=UPI001C44AF2E|nr:MarR family winged helix-turn-helix transcriptional regulator [Streptomyces sp. TRM70350]MBV7695725.1 MarR family winged helix-turn-helix transcriptional regulator [Streptomyces sp. TRM70350]
MTQTPATDPAAECNNLTLRKAARYLGATYDKALAPTGLRATQFSILQKLSAHGETTITSLADMTAMDRTTKASNLKPLARDGLVTVEPSASDRRARVVTITEDGLSRTKTALPLWREVQQRFEERFGTEEAARLRALLDGVLGTGFEPWAE